jgi:hypothetical protein
MPRMGRASPGRSPVDSPVHRIRTGTLTGTGPEGVGLKGQSQAEVAVCA